jgi:hypothetical protein
MSSKSSKEINKLLPHAFLECSDLPALPPLFSCHACDAWRARIHCKGSRSINRRDFLSDRYQCSREKEGRPIRIRVVCKAAGLADPRIASGTTLKLLAEKAEKCQPLSMTERRSSRIRSKQNRESNDSRTDVVGMASSIRTAPSLSVKSKSKRASEIIARLDNLKRIKEREDSRLFDKEQKAVAAEMFARARAVEIAADKKMQIAQLKESEFSTASKTLEEIKKEVEDKQAALAEYNNELKKKRNLARYYNQESIKSMACDDVTQLTRVIEGALKGKHNNTKAKLLMEAIASGKLFNGAATNLQQEKFKEYVRQLFRPWKLVKAADVSAVGAFKSSTINALRSVIDEKKDDLFPSDSTVSRVRRLLDNYGSEKVGWERRMTRHGEVFYVNFEKAFRLLLKACELDEVATRSSVKVALTVDGADIFRGRTHVSTGIKITDERGVHPVTKQPFSMVNEDLDETYFLKVQSSEVCCVMIIADAVDSKEIYTDVFKEYYDWGESIRLHGLPASELGPALRPFSVVFSNDLKGTWYLTGKGGGC